MINSTKTQANIQAIKFDTASALSYLKTLYDDGYIVLTAICPNTKSILTTTFLSHQDDQIAEWIERRQGHYNIYYNLNSVIKPLKSKSSRQDIKSVDYLHVDIDPEDGKDVQEEQERILKLAKEFRIKPTLIVFSGGGYQFLWRLKHSIPVNGDITKAEAAKLYNKQLEIELGGDNCHNIDRILRLPGTINVPDEKKLKKGRKPALATIVEHNPANIYDIEEFTKAEEKPVSKAKEIVPGNVSKLDSLNEIDIADWAKELILTGERKGKNYKSRSEALFAVICELTRCVIEPDIIFAVITDTKFKISASVLDKPNPSKYAIRQIERGQEHAIAAWLAELNDKHSVVKNWGGKCRVATFAHDHELKRAKIDVQSFSDIVNSYMNRTIQVGETSKGKPIMRNIGDMWLKHEMRREYDTVVFSPKEDIPNALNLWEGFAIKPVQGCWDLMKSHITNIIACGDVKSAEYVTNWMAFAVQYPEKPAEVALVLKGGKGTGKGVFGNALCRIFGQHSMHISHINHLTGRFNAHLSNACLLFADEAYWPGHKSEEGTIKALITEPMLTIERKGIDAVQMPNRLHIIMASNEDWVVPATTNERRYAIFEVSSKCQQDSEYFSKLFAEIDNGGLEAMLYDLQNMDIKCWHPRKDIPKTAALEEQKIKGLKPIEKLWFDCLVSGDFLNAAATETFISTTWLVEKVNSLSKYNDVTAKEVANFLGKSKLNQDGSLKQQGSMGFEKRDKRPRGFMVPDLKTCRSAWDKVMFSVDWDDATEWSKL